MSPFDTAALTTTIRPHSRPEPPAPASTDERSQSLPAVTVGYADPTLDADHRGGSACSEIVATRLLGEGGMGRVYAAHQRSLDREIAVKVPRALAPRASAVRQLVDEARLLGALQHPNIVPVHALGQDDLGRPIILMKKIEGVLWSTLIDDPDHEAWGAEAFAAEDRLTAHLRILAQVASALHYAHSQGVVHRDVKPENVIVGSFGEVYLLDWGVAHSLHHEDPVRGPVGSPGYMAPEMVLGGAHAVTPRTDVYLLGASLHRVLTGSCRHDAPSVEAALDAALISKPFSYGAQVPRPLAELCNAATNVDPELRPPSAAAFRTTLVGYVQHRASITIARSARAALEEAHSMLRAGQPPLGRHVLQRLTEARFGFMEALRGWPDTEVVADLQTCLVSMIELELEQRNANAARALLSEMARPPAQLTERLTRLDAELAEAREHERALRTWAREHDRTLSIRGRVLAMSVFALSSVAAAIDSLRTELVTGRPMPVGDLLPPDFALIGVWLLAVLVGRKVWFANRYNRKVVFSVGLMTLLATSLDLMSWWRGLDSRTGSLIDLIAMTGCFALVAVGWERTWWWLSGICAAITLLVLPFPWLTNAGPPLAISFSVALAILAMVRAAKRGSAGRGAH